MMDGWNREVKLLRDEVKQKEEKWIKEREDVGIKYKSLLKLVQATKSVLFTLRSLLHFAELPRSF